ncbi:MAG: V-type ATPase subunit [Clostridia bacterium]|nr:V-type ATPase subunit [Clostridia bacterium]
MADYLYGSANLRARESAIVSGDRIARLADAKTIDEAYAQLSEYGVFIERDPESGKILREETLLAILKKAYETTQELAPDSEALRLWLYPYDCNNLKAAIKCSVRGIDPRSMLFDFGTVKAEEIVSMVETGNFEGVPDAMQGAAAEAIALYARTQNPQLIDLVLDKACYRDMLSCATASGDSFTQRLVRAKIDLTNVMTTVRILRMNSGEAGKALMEDAFIEGGRLLRTELFGVSEEALWERLRYTEYASFADAVLTGNGSLSSIECSLDDFIMEIVKETKFIPVGLEVMVAFLLAHEYEVKNLRIVLAGKEAGLSPSVIRERIRKSYV